MSIQLQLVAKISCEAVGRAWGGWYPLVKVETCPRTDIYVADAESVSLSSFSAEASAHFQSLGWNLTGRICPACRDHMRLWRQSSISFQEKTSGDRSTA